MATRNEAVQQEWRPKYCFTMELKHGLMGYFPLIHKTKFNPKGNGKIIVCANRTDFKKIWEALPKKEVQIEKILFLINEDETEVVVAENDRITSEELFFIKELEECNVSETFEYAKGLLSFKDESEVTFPEELP